MPTLTELKELVDKCFWDWTIQDGAQGYKITGPNRNSIFLPAAGDREGIATTYDNFGRYWSATLDEYGNWGAYYISINQVALGNDHYGVYTGERCDGLTIRPVIE